MIGGADIILDGLTTSDDADFIVRGVRSMWPNAFIQNVNDTEAVPIRDFKFPVLASAELLIYRDAESYESWQTDGATDDNQNAMVHVMISERSVTIVVDESKSKLGVSINELLEALRRNRFVYLRVA